jgi:DNA-binding XRE family transcriptional regulator
VKATRITYWIARGRRIILLDTRRTRSDAMNDRKTWSEMRDELVTHPDAQEAYEAAGIRYQLGREVRERREALGMTQDQLARAAGLEQPAVARLEAGGTMPTLPLLERIAAALGTRLSVTFEPLDRAT